MEHSKCCGWILPFLVLVFTIWPQGTWSKWIVVVSAVLLLVHAFGWGCGDRCGVETAKGKKKKKK